MFTAALVFQLVEDGKLKLTDTLDKFYPQVPNANKIDDRVMDAAAVSEYLRDGDLIVKVDTTHIKDINTVKGQIILKEARSLTVKRGDSIIVLNLDEGLTRKLNTRSSGPFISVRAPFIVKRFGKESNAEKAGMLPEDRIVAVNNIETPFFSRSTKSHYG